MVNTKLRTLTLAQKENLHFTHARFKTFFKIAVLLDILFKTSRLFLFIYVDERLRSGSVVKVHRLSNTYV